MTATLEGGLRRTRARMVFSALVAGGLSAGCSRQGPPLTRDSLPVVPVAVAPVERSLVIGSQQVAGIVRPFERALAASRIIGQMVEANLAIGQRMEAG